LRGQFPFLGVLVRLQSRAHLAIS